jgi:glycosyltransferase involved in cell wall biosynthesis
LNPTQIIGIVLIKNEDLFIETVLRNILDFCDRIFVADHHSTDLTPEIVKRFAAAEPKIDYRVVDHPSESHDIITGFAGGPNWVIGVDGDEIYDPEGLCRFREELLTGRYHNTFKLLGNVLNVRYLDNRLYRVRGYLAPPCRSMTKLYNFSAIKSWPSPCPERLHGGQIEYKAGYSDMSFHRLLDEVSWEDSPFRCLHLCFTHRSSLDLARGNQVAIRKGVGERKLWRYNLRSWLMSFFGREDIPYFKRQYYMRGAIVEKDVRVFGL